MNPDPKTHCFFCRKKMRDDGGLHTCYDVVEVLETKIKELEETNKWLRWEIENGRKNESEF